MSFVPKELKPTHWLGKLFPDAPVAVAPEIPKASVLAPAESATAAESAAKAQQIAEKRRKGKSSTILTSGLGLTEDATTKKPTILGTR